MKRLTIILCAAILPALFSGCQNTVNTAENRNKTMKTDYMLSRYVSTDRFCRDRLVIDGINRKVLSTGFMMIQINFRSSRTGFWSELWSDITGANPYKVEYKIDWFDKDGMKIDTPTSTWTEVDFIPGESKYIKSVAPNIRCKDFKINMKEYGE